MTAFVPPPAVPSAQAQQLYDEDVADSGDVMNLSRVWAHRPELQEGLFDLLRTANAPLQLSMRERGILVTSAAAALGDSYCALAWGERLAQESTPAIAAAVLAGDTDDLTPRERALATWSRAVADDPNATTAAQVDDLRQAGWTDEEIVGITVFVALRLAFSTVNDALGVRPDAAYRSTAPAEVLGAVTWGRPIEEA
ncbi:hypothetical protein GIS00_13780 [Nakamurella sp. YIM 132087]|uniref:Carboxymuconolactone decarboxylase family protein n=1 Tax=Nakamurella alba TaxID=2665158 RepID=A0A7K1FNW8_9ACTN|nr:hypothetical protein [Nakamurella alba]MTD15009.1 hypothetical protein [Nakamurella alba]